MRKSLLDVVTADQLLAIHRGSPENNQLISTRINEEVKDIPNKLTKSLQKISQISEHFSS